MAIKINADGHREIVDIKGKVDKNYFPKSWCAVRLGIDKSTTLLFNLYAKNVRRRLNKEATEKAGCNIYGVVYIIHPDMVSTRIREVSVNDMMDADQQQQEAEVVEEPKKAEVPKESRQKETPVKAKVSKTDIVTGAEAIQLIKSVHNCSAEVLDILLQYCKFSTLQVDVKTLIEAYKKERI